jgi:selenocysteine lyase/cysteine desulfurase
MFNSSYCRHFPQNGFDAPDDFLRLQRHDAIRPDTILVSIPATNNLIGTIQPLAELGAVWTNAA